MTLDVDKVVQNFREALLGGRTAWYRAALWAQPEEPFEIELEAAFDDWAEAQWELLVERPLLKSGGYLQMYGGGTDYELAAHCRVFFRDASPTHEIYVEAAEGAVVVDLLSGACVDPAALEFDRLVSFRNGTYDSIAPPLDHVLLCEGSRGEGESSPESRTERKVSGYVPTLRVVHQSLVRFALRELPT